MDTPIRFKDFSFYPEAGELVRRDATGKEHSGRLAPQPAKLLRLLLEKYPAVVSQEEIKEAIWPEVQVDYERSLHYCIRQIRAALDDNATAPDFIETISRRGYRWIAEIDQEEGVIPATPVPSVFSIRKVSLIGALALVIMVAFALLPWRKSNVTDPGTGSDPIRVAVMSFQPEEVSNAFWGNDIALRLVESLTNNYQDAYQVIGPTTTVNYPPGELPQLIRDLDIDCIINGRFSQVQDTSRLLAEVIRAADGAHIWVKYFYPQINRDTMVETILAGFESRFNAARVE